MSKKSKSNRWYLRDVSGAYWPGALPWRTEGSALAGRGYPSEGVAIARARVIMAHYIAHHGVSMDLVPRYAHDMGAL